MSDSGFNDWVKRKALSVRHWCSIRMQSGSLRFLNNQLASGHICEFCSQFPHIWRSFLRLASPGVSEKLSRLRFLPFRRGRLSDS